MSMPDEKDVLQSMKESLRLAAENCERLAVHPFRGFVYDQMRKQLKEVETCCMRIGYYRGGDARWLYIAPKMHEAHLRCGHWLRNSPGEDDRAKAVPLFRKLAEVLRSFLRTIDNLENKATGRIGAIVPKEQHFHRENRPVAVRRPSGLIVPAGVRV